VYDRFVEQFRSTGIGVQTGVFQAMMEVDLVNDGPITLWIESSPLAQGPSRVV
jgi:D-tyrosyl-tRNA(Tyr) deacylase